MDLADFHFLRPWCPLPAAGALLLPAYHTLLLIYGWAHAISGARSREA